MGSPASVTAASSVLERLPVSRWHWRLVVLVGIGTFFDLYEVFLGGVLAPVLAKEFELGTSGQVHGDRGRVRRHVHRRERAVDRRGPARAPPGLHPQPACLLAVLIRRRVLAEHRDIPRAARSSPASGWAPSWFSSTPIWPSSCPPSTAGG